MGKNLKDYFDDNHEISDEDILLTMIDLGMEIKTEKIKEWYTSHVELKELKEGKENVEKVEDKEDIVNRAKIKAFDDYMQHNLEYGKTYYEITREHIAEEMRCTLNKYVSEE